MTPTNTVSGMLLSALDYEKGIPTPTAVYTPIPEALRFETSYNYPNPFRDKTTVKFNMDKKTDVTVSVYDVNHRIVWHKTLSAGEVNMGPNYVVWDGKNESGLPAANGVYMLEIETDKTIVRKKAAIVR